jgi:predicted nuclease of predicted toxin-antitoxin system
MKPALLVNENFPHPATLVLRSQDVDVLSVLEIMPAASDKEVLAKARQLGRWIVTFDRDYGDLVFRERLPPPPAILFLRQEPSPPEHYAQVVNAMMAQADQVEGCLVVITHKQTKLQARFRRFTSAAENQAK